MNQKKKKKKWTVGEGKRREREGTNGKANKPLPPQSRKKAFRNTVWLIRRVRVEERGEELKKACE